MENISPLKNKKLQHKKMCMFICIKNDELKSDNITVENEGVVEYGNDLINCKIIHDKGSI